MFAVAEVIGARVRWWRKLRNLTQRELGELCGYSEDWVSAVERGVRSAGADRLVTLVPLLQALRVDLRTMLTVPIPGVPSAPEEFLAVLAETLGLNAQIASSARMLGNAGPDVLVLARDPRGGQHIMHRRDAIKRGLEVMGVVSVGAFALDLDQTQAVAHALDTREANSEAIDAYRGILNALSRAEDQVGSEPGLLQAAETHLDTVKGWMSTAGSDALRGDLARLATEYAASCGWMAYDAGNPKKAVALHRDGLELAQMLADRPLAAFLTSRIARIETETGNTQAAVRTAARAVGLANGTPAWRVRATVQSTAGWVLARAGDKAASLAAIGAAEEAIARKDGVDTPYVYWVTENEIARWRGGSLVYLGEHATAQERLRELIAAMPEHLVRDRAKSLMDLAESHAMNGDVVGACEAARDAGLLLRAASSARILRRARRLHGQLTMSGKAHASRVKELGEQLKGL